MKESFCCFDNCVRCHGQLCLLSIHGLQLFALYWGCKYDLCMLHNTSTLYFKCGYEMLID